MNRNLLVFKEYARRLVSPLNGLHPAFSAFVTVNACVALLATCLMYGKEIFPIELKVLPSSMIAALYLMKLANNSVDWDHEIFERHGFRPSVRRQRHRFSTASFGSMILGYGGFIELMAGKLPENFVAYGMKVTARELVGITAIGAVGLGYATHRNLRQYGGWRSLLKPLPPGQ